MLEINDQLGIPERLLTEQFIRASGPGGQNVNKVATAVQLRFHLAAWEDLEAAARRRLIRLAGSRHTEAGEILIEAKRHRTRERNREDARERLADLIRQALIAPRPRKKRHRSKAENEARLRTKHQKSQTKKARKTPPVEGY